MSVFNTKLTLNDITLLGLLNESDSGFTGKQLEETIEDRNMRVWTKIGKSSIYSNLKKLEQKNFVSVKVQLTQLKEDSTQYHKKGKPI